MNTPTPPGSGPVSKRYLTSRRGWNAGPYLLFANDRPITLPSFLARSVLGVTGLDNAAPVLPLTKFATSKAAAKASCSSYYGQHMVAKLPPRFGTTRFPTPICGYFDSLNVMRTSEASAGSLGISWELEGAGLPLWVNPSDRKVTAGRMYSSTTAQLGSPGHVQPSYEYNLDFPAPPGAILPQRFRAVPASLATVDERFAADLRSPGQITFTGENLSQRSGAVGFTGGNFANVPLAQTQYFTAGDGIMWQAQACTSPPPNSQRSTGRRPERLRRSPTSRPRARALSSPTK